MGTLFVDYENGNNNYSGSSFDPLASGSDGVISGVVSGYGIFSSASANFPNDNSIAPTKNEAWYSEHLQVYGVSNNITTIRDSITAPPSGINGYVFRLVENTSNVTHYMSSVSQYTPIYVGTQYTFSIYVKANGRNKIILRYDADARSARYNLSNGTVEETGASASSSITYIGDGWYRLSLTITTPAGSGYSAENWQIYMVQDSYNNLAASSSSYTGDNISGIYISAMQIEPGSSATSYELPAYQLLSIFTGSTYTTFHIAERISSTSLRINVMNSSTAPTAQSARQYYIGGRLKTISTTGLSAARTIPGDNIRIMASPYPTIVGSGTWSTLTGLAGAGTSNVVSATNASPIVVGCASSMATLGISDGDTVLITGNTSNTNSNGTWEVTATSGNFCTLVGSSGNFNQTTSNGLLRKITQRIVKLDTPVTANIASYGNRGNGRTTWTASTNVTATFDSTDSKEGDVNDTIAIGAAFTTGKAAYKATGSLDLSGYQQVSFYIKQTAGTVAVSGDVSLRLCSDTIGDTTVHTINIPPMLNLNQWIPFTINLGTNMNNNIQSIALYVDADKGAQTFLLSNIIACKAASSPDSLNLQSLISKNTADECWYPIMSINGTRIMIGIGNNANTNPISTANRGGYYGVTETVPLYKRETIKTTMVSSAGTVVQEIQEAGSLSSSSSYEFGYDRTNMTTRDSQTYFDGLNGLGYGLVLSSKSYVNISNAGMVRYDRGFRFISSTFGNHGFLEGINNTNYGIDLTSAQSFNTYSDLRGCCNSNYGIGSDFGSNVNIYQKIISTSNLSYGIYLSRGFSENKLNNILSATNSYGMFFDSASNNIYTSGNFIQNGTDGVRYYTGTNEQYINCITSGNLTNGLFSFGGDTYLKNCIVNESVEFGNYGWSNSRIYAINHDNIANNSFITTDYGTIRPQTSIRYNNSGYAWAMAPTNTIRSASYPLDFIIAKIAVSSNALVTVRAWMRRTNTLLTTGLRIKGGQIAGVPNDITSYMNAAADTWEQVTLSFTPTEVGVVEILAECYGGSTYTAYVDDLSVTQV